MLGVLSERMDLSKSMADMPKPHAKVRNLKRRYVRLPRVVRVARHLGVYIPARVRQDRDAMISWFEQMAPDSWFAYLTSSSKRTRGIFERDEGIWPVSCVESIRGADEASFFIPAPYKRKFCNNTRTTLLSDVHEICAPLAVNIRQLDSKRVSAAALQNRKVVAYGKSNFYRIYELEELMQAWKCAGNFVLPEAPVSAVFRSYSVAQLLQLLGLEYSQGIAADLSQLIREVLHQRSAAQKSLDELKQSFLELSEVQQVKLQEFLQWLLFAALLMRGWNLDVNQFAVSQATCHSVRPAFRKNLTFALGKLLNLQYGLELNAHILLSKLQPVDIAVVKSESSEQPADEEDDEEEESGSDEDEETETSVDIDWSAESTGITDGLPKESEKKGGEGGEESKSEPRSRYEIPEKLVNPSVDQVSKPSESTSESTPSQTTSKSSGSSGSEKSSKSVPDTISADKLNEQCQTVLRQLFPEKKKEEDDLKCENPNTIQVKIPDSTVSLKSSSFLLRLLKEVIKGNTCYREASRTLLQSAAFYLDLFFEQRVDKLPLVCIEELS